MLAIVGVGCIAVQLAMLVYRDWPWSSAFVAFIGFTAMSAISLSIPENDRPNRGDDAKK